MTNNQSQINSELLSVAQLVKSTVVAIVLASIILVTVVLPAEYGIDPTGIGNALGLKQMGEIKTSLSQEVALEQNKVQTQTTEVKEVVETAGPKVEEAIASRTDKMTIALKPNQGKEIKLRMKQGAKVKFSWWTSQGKANFDTHADSKKLKINYRNYEKGKKAKDEGILEAQFDGKHGWFWRNRTSTDMNVTLQVEGDYSDITQEG